MLNKNNIENLKNHTLIKTILPFLKNGNFYIVGGFIRDFFRNENNYDIDIVVTDGDSKKIAIHVAKNLHATCIELDKEWGIYRVILKDKLHYIDFANALHNNIYEDLKRRDLTINSIAIDLATFTILDINNGLNDLEHGILNAIDEQNFINDPLRLLRVFRFQAKFGYKIEEKTLSYIKKHAYLIHNSAQERINSELLSLFDGDFTTLALMNLDKSDLLEEIFPFLKDIKTIPPNSHHHLTLFNHILETVTQVHKIYKTLPKEAKSILDNRTNCNIRKLACLKFAAFLHDIGKPSTWTIEEDTGRHRFINHAELGAKLIIPMLKKMLFSKKQIQYITKMIKYHILPSVIDINSDKSVLKFIRKINDDVVDLVVLAMADRLSARGEAITSEIINNNINNLTFLMTRYLEVKDTLVKLPKLLSGHEIMEILNIKEGVELGKIIKKLQQAQMDSDVVTKEEAIMFIKNLKKSIV